MPADLHVHTNLSDGTDSPEETVKMAKSAGLTALSITDHDTVDGLASAIKTGKETGIEVIPGIEFTTEDSEAEIHILGYFFDIKNKELLELLSKLKLSRHERIFKIVEKLNGFGVEITPEQVFKFSKNGVPGRPHVARALIESGAVTTIKEAFNKYLASYGPAYVSHYKLTPHDAVRLIKNIGGVSSFAHPCVSNCDEIIVELLAQGLNAIETYYPTHSAEQVNKYRNLAKKYGLLMTGGSDFHGENSGRNAKLGDVTISDDLVNKLREASGK